MAVYIPRQGDIIAITFDPQSGHEQKGRRHALVVSKDLFNRSTGLAIVCPLTNTAQPSAATKRTQNRYCNHPSTVHSSQQNNRVRSMKFLDKISTNSTLVVQSAGFPSTCLFRKTAA
jgi:mRNA-degrading endonuclease toxin of MazEF toxin-antitoxin module